MKKFTSKQIFEGLYSSLAFKSEDIRQCLKDAKLKLPVNVMAVELKGHLSESLKLDFLNLKVWIVNSDNGMLYITYNGLQKDMEQICNKQGLLHGNSIPCDNVEQWRRTLQMAIVSVRQNYLDQLQNAELSHAAWTDEREQFFIAMEAFPQDPNWRKHVSLWLNIVLTRSSKALTDCHRKIISFLTFATANIDRDNSLSFIFQQAIRKIENTCAFSDFQQVIISILEAIHPYVMLHNSHAHISQHLSEPVKKAVEYMRKSYMIPISRKNVATVCFVCPEYLSRIFKHETSYTITEYLQILRVDYAKQLLVKSNKEIFSVAMESGFNSITHFHRVFKKQTKMTPLHYRKVNTLIFSKL